MTKTELIDLVGQMLAFEGDERTLDALLYRLRANAPHPEVLNLIYYGDANATAESIVEQALNPPTFFL